MKNILMAAVAAVTLGMTGVALAGQPIVRHAAQGQVAGNEVVLPNQRPAYLAENNHEWTKEQRPAYLAENNHEWTREQRPAYLAENNHEWTREQRPAYLA
jgi:hypothetical protein